MRRIVSIDGTWLLKGKYDDTLLVASVQDEDFHQYHLAWAVVDVESIASWSWFLTKLLEVVVDEEDLVIISDRHSGIIAIVADVYKNAHHEFLDENDSLDQWTRAYSPRSRYQNASIASTTNFTPTIESILRERYNFGRGYQVYELGRLQFDVRSATNSDIGDLESKRCTFREFEIDKIPCSHEIAASYFCDVNFYSLCSEYYSVMIWSLAYSETIYHVLNQNEWPVDDMLVLPPVIKRIRGRKKQNRFSSVREFGRR
ncbi:uncharacterized protein LOC142554590 [Primulina tabacum]|uniref:uncharacterized protein LOC142554590 n=1 Tax=Primulina tabacum TaxID=48773 RepID=UPI003F5A4FD6